MKNKNIIVGYEFDLNEFNRLVDKYGICNDRETTIHWTCEAAPLQAEGKIDNRYWYFRARHNYWNLSVGNTKKDALDGTILSIGAVYKPKIKHAASWMSKEDGKKFIEYGMLCYKDWKRLR